MTFIYELILSLSLVPLITRICWWWTHKLNEVMQAEILQTQDGLVLFLSVMMLVNWWWTHKLDETMQAEIRASDERRERKIMRARDQLRISGVMPPILNTRRKVKKPVMNGDFYIGDSAYCAILASECGCEQCVERLNDLDFPRNFRGHPEMLQ